MQLGNIEIENPLILGPMAGVTDWAFRTTCASLGADIWQRSPNYGRGRPFGAGDLRL